MSDEPHTIPLSTVAEWIGATVEGDASATVTGLAPMDEAGPRQLTFAADPKRESRLGACKAGAVIVSRSAPAAAIPLLRVDDVPRAMAALLAALADPEDLPPVGVHASAVVDETAVLGDGVAIGPNVVVGPQARLGAGAVLCAGGCLGRGAVLGEQCVLREGVKVLAGCRLGARVRVGPNSVIGYDGFGYYFDAGTHHKIPHVGIVVVEDDVEIGACSCVDRAKFGETVVGAGTKVDNLVQIAHNVKIGPGCILVGQVGLAGSSTLGAYTVVGGGSGVRDNVHLGERVSVAAHSAVAGDVPDGQTVAGTPAMPASEAMRIIASWRKLPDLLRRVKELEAKVKALGGTEDNP